MISDTFEKDSLFKKTINVQCDASVFSTQYIWCHQHKYLSLLSQESWLVNIESACCRIRNIIAKVKHKILSSKKEIKGIYNYVQLLV